MNILDRVVYAVVRKLTKHLCSPRVCDLQVGGVDVVLSLGRGIPGGEPTLAQAANIEQAVSLSSAWNAFLFVTGGYSENGKEHGKITESLVMKNYALAQGFPPERIVEDSLSMDTRSSLVVLREQMEVRGWTSAVVVADFTHALRVRSLCRRMFPLDAPIYVFPAHWDPNEGDLGMSLVALMFWELLAQVASYLPHGLVKRLRGFQV